MNKTVDVIVAGQICLDIIPSFGRGNGQESIAGLFVPGKLIDIGAAVIATGGAVSNTGQALHRLGVPVSLISKVGDDLFGQAILELIGNVDKSLTNDMIVTANESTAYTIVINPPGIDRIFLHCTGTNDTFSSHDLQYDQLPEAKMFHFGYPPLMRNMYMNDGEQLIEIFSRIKHKGMTTSLDMAKPDPHSEAGKVDWLSLLQKLLPHVDVFLPSFEEILFMLDRHLYEQLEQQHGASGLLQAANPDLLRKLSEQMIRMGAAIVGIKLGENGLYVRTSADTSRMKATGYCAELIAENWLNRELFIPCFEVEVAGTTGAGDSTIAGFLAGLLRGLTVEEVATYAAAVGACAVEQPDATSGVPKWDIVMTRINAGWTRHSLSLPLDGWRFDPVHNLYLGPQEPST